MKYVQSYNKIGVILLNFTFEYYTIYINYILNLSYAVLCIIYVRRYIMSDKRIIKLAAICSAILLIEAMILIKIDSIGSFISTLFSVFSPVFIGIATAFVLNKPMMWLRGKIRKRSHRLSDRAVKNLSVAAVYVLFLLIVTAIIGFIVPQFADSVRLFSKNFNAYYENFMKFYNSLSEKLDVEWLNDLLNDRELLDNIRQKAAEAANHIPELLGGIFGVTYNIVTGAVNVIIGFIISIYILADKEALLKGAGEIFKAALPEKAYEKLRKVKETVVSAFSNFITGQLTEAAILGTLCFIGMSILGLEYALLISVLVAVTSLIPIVGAFVGTVPGVIILLLVKPIQAVWFVIFIIVIQQIEGNLIYPKVVGSSVGLSPLFTLIAITVGGGIGGILGMLVAVPITSVICTAVNGFVADRRPAESAEAVEDVLFESPDEDVDDETEDIQTHESHDDNESTDDNNENMQ